jgi:diguanylate cyclase (GGDEF)-like protein
LRQDIETSALIDPITNLLDRGGLELAFQRLSKLPSSKLAQLFLLLIEIDNREGIQQAYGEKALRSLRVQLGQVIDTSFRGRDITASLGDEFICVLQQVSQEKALEIAERFRESIAEKEFNCVTAKGNVLKCTVSIGVVAANTTESIRTPLNHARIAIAEAKSSGGNRCVSLR